jgi:hypothetical protein
MLERVESLEQLRQRGFLDVSHHYTLAKMNATERVNVHSLLIREVLVQTSVKLLPWSPWQAFNEFLS